MPIKKALVKHYQFLDNYIEFYTIIITFKPSVKEEFKVKRYHEHLLISKELRDDKETSSVVKLGRILHKTAHILNNTHNRSLSDLKLNTQQTVILSFIFQNEEEGVNSRDLEDLLSLTNPSVSSVVSTMEKNQLILKRKDPRDLRNQLLYLTDSGRKIAQESSIIMIKNNLETFGILDLKEQTELFRLLEKVFTHTSKL